jgi:hypothetical protein
VVDGLGVTSHLHIDFPRLPYVGLDIRVGLLLVAEELPLEVEE